MSSASTVPHAGHSPAEDLFIDLFADVFGPEKAQYLFVQYPFIDIYGKNRYIDFAIKDLAQRVAIEIDGGRFHDPAIISQEKYHDDLLKQNCLTYNGWQIYRWTYNQLKNKPEKCKDELRTFLGEHPMFRELEAYLPEQHGRVFEVRDLELYEHQQAALAALEQMRSRNETIALLHHATGLGKTVTAVEDARRLGGRTLMLAHTRELVEQAARQFRQRWPEVSTGIYMDTRKELDAHVVCGSIQSVAQNIQDFHPDDFQYLIIDECHHSTADTYQRILGWLKPAFTLGLTATPERADGEDLLAVFKQVAHKLDLKTAVEMGELVPVRCIRIRTNVDLSEVRFSGFKYNAQDLEDRILVPGRNDVIVATWLDMVRDKPTVIFCISVDHAKTVSGLLRERGISAEAVSGSMDPTKRKATLAAYERGDIHVLCACDLLNEGWDSPHTQVLFMARPTLSKTLYMQQLGRGMRKYEGKEALMVFDFVDNANLFNQGYSLHRLLQIKDYQPGRLVLAPKQPFEYDEYLYAQGEKPELLIDYPIHIMDYEAIDLFNWQEQTKDMVSQMEFVRQVSVQSETIERYIREGKIRPDMTVPMSEHRQFHYFNPETVRRYSQEFGWTLITSDNIKDLFIDMIRTMDMSYSYKPVFLRAFFQHMDRQGRAPLEDVARAFASHYEQRRAQGMMAEKASSIMQKGGYTEKDVQRLILSMPFKRFEDMRFLKHSKSFGVIELDETIHKRLTDTDLEWIDGWCEEKLREYYELRCVGGKADTNLSQRGADDF